MSGRKNNLPKFQIITSGDMSTASLTSTVVNVEYFDNIIIQTNWSGAPVGTFAVQISVDHAQDQMGNVTVAGNWTALPFSSAPTPAGTTDYGVFDINQISAPWIRLVYTKSSGTGTLNAYISGKML